MASVSVESSVESRVIPFPLLRPAPFTVYVEPAAVGQNRGIALAMLFDRLDQLPGDDLDAARLHLAAQVGTNLVVEAAQDVLAAVDQRHL